MEYFRLTLYSTLIVVALGGWCDNKQTAGQELVSAYNRLSSVTTIRISKTSDFLNYYFKSKGKNN